MEGIGVIHVCRIANVSDKNVSRGQVRVVERCVSDTVYQIRYGVMVEIRRKRLQEQRPA